MTNKEKKIYAKFLKENPSLAKSKATIDINAFLGEYDSTTGLYKNLTTPKIFLTVNHQFIFDKRLIPKSFNGYEVKDTLLGDYPLQYFPVTDDPMPLDRMFDPERYIAFVNDNLELIRKELDNTLLTKEEALDALTGGFDKHIEWFKEARASTNSDKSIEK